MAEKKISEDCGVSTNKLGGRATTKRVCHDCGKPTYNYRCNSCWKKIRGENYFDMDLPEKDRKIRNV